MTTRVLLAAIVSNSHTIIAFARPQVSAVLAPICVILFGSPQAHASAQEPSFEDNAIAAACSVPLRDNHARSWSEQEKWAWNRRLCLGEIADLRDFPGDASADCDVSTTEHWSDARELTSNFMKEILFFDPYRSHSNQRGVQILCAVFPERLDLSFGDYERPIWLTHSYFRRGIDATKARLHRDFSIAGSRVAGPFLAAGIMVGGDLNFNGAILQAVNVGGAKVEGSLQASGSRLSGAFRADDITVGAAAVLRNGRFTTMRLIGAVIANDLDLRAARLLGGLIGDRMRVGGNVFLNGSEEYVGAFQQVDLLGADVGGELNALRACFRTSLNAQGLKLGGNLFLGLRGDLVMDNDPCITPAVTEFQTLLIPSRATLGSLVLSGADIGGNLIVRQVSIAGRFNAAGVSVAGDLILGGHSAFEEIYLQNAYVEGNVLFDDNRFSRDVDLSNSRVVGTLFLTGTGIPPAGWDYNSRLLLRNLSVREFRYREDAVDNLEGRLDLNGFRYDELGGEVTSEHGGDSDSRTDFRLAWLLDSWLGSQVDRVRVFQPQPYQQLAVTLRDEGHVSLSNTVMVALKNYERGHETTAPFDKAVLTLSWILIGYGYRVWQAVLCFLVLVLLGVVILASNDSGRSRGLVENVYFSLESAVPLVQLSPSHQQFARDLGPGIRRYFVLHKLLGLIVVSVLVAGLTGLVT